MHLLDGESNVSECVYQLNDLSYKNKIELKKYPLTDVGSSTLYRIMLHGALQCVVDLIIYWRWEEVLFYVDPLEGKNTY